MAEINDFIDPKAEAQVKTYINSLGEIVKQYGQIFDGAVKINAATNNVLKSQKSVSDAQKQANEVSKEAARLAKEQASAAASLDKQRQAALNSIAKQAAKEKDLVAAINMEVRSINDAQRQNKALNEVKKRLDLTTESGKNKLKEYNKTLDKNTEFIRENSTAAGKQAMNVGNYKSAFDGAKNTLLGFAGALGIATGAMSLIKGVIDATDSASDKFEETLGGVKNGVHYFAVALSELDFSNFLSNMKDAIKAGKDYVSALDEIGDRTRAQGIIDAQSAKRIAELDIASKNMNLTTAQRKTALDELLVIEKKNADMRLDLARTTEKTELDYAASQTGLSQKRIKELLIENETNKEVVRQAKDYLSAISLINSSKAEKGTTGGAILSLFGSTKDLDAAQKTIDNTSQSIKKTADELYKLGRINEDRYTTISESIKNAANEEASYYEENNKRITRSNKLTNDENELIQKNKDEYAKASGLAKKALDEKIAAENSYNDSFAAMLYEGTEAANKEYAKRNADFDKSLENDLESAAKKGEEELKALQDYNAALLAEQVASAQRIADAKVNILKKQLATGQISEAEYSQAVFELDKQGVQSTIDGIKLLLESTAEGTAGRQELLTQLANAQQNLDNITTDNFINNENLKQAKLQETLQQVQNLGGLAFDFVSALYDRQAQKYEEAKQKELAAAGDNEEKKSKIEENYAKKAAALKRKQAIADKLGALFQIALNTAIGATNAASKVVTLPLVPFIIAAGALQAAAVLAKPIPAYKDGVKSAPRGLALVGEAGAELVEKNNRMQLVDTPSLVNLAGGETIYKNADTQKILASRKISPTSNDQGALVQTIVSSNNKVIRAIETKKELYISASGSKIVERDGDYYTEYFNRKISWAGKRNSQH